MSSTFIGAVAWLLSWIAGPGSPIVCLFLLAPLVVVPALWGTLPARWLGGHRRRPVVLVALPLVPAVAIQSGPVAGALVVPWLALGAVAWVRTARALGLREPEWWGTLVVLALFVVGAGFLLLDRLGAQPLGFPGTIVLLTAVHFHFAGFGLGVLLLHALRRQPKLAPAFIALAAGMVGTAAGFALAQATLSAIGAVLVAGAGLACGLDLLAGGRIERTLRRRVGAAVAGGALLVGMPLGVGWAVATAAGIAFLPLDVMVRTHGALNATAIVIGSLLVGTGRR